MPGRALCAADHAQKPHLYGGCRAHAGSGNRWERSNGRIVAIRMPMSNHPKLKNKDHAHKPETSKAHQIRAGGVQARLDEDYASRESYRALTDRGIALSSYTITSVARQLGLSFVDGDAGLLQWLLECQSVPNVHSLKLDDYVNARLNLLQHSKGLHPQPLGVKKVLLDLPGNYIIGSKDGRHYLTLEVDGRLSLKAMDPQDGATYLGPRIKTKLPAIDLALKII